MGAARDRRSARGMELPPPSAPVATYAGYAVSANLPLQTAVELDGVFEIA